MPELVTAAQYQLVPDVGKALQQGTQTAAGFQQLQAGREQLNQLRQDRKFKTATMNALRLQNLGPEQQVEELKRQITQANVTGEDPTGRQELLNMLQTGKVQEANQTINQAVSFGQQMGVIPQPQGFTSVATRGGLPTGIRGGVMQQIPTAPGVAEAMARAPEEVSQVQSSKILSGGLVQIVRKDGTTDVVRLEDAERELVKSAELRGASMQGMRAAEREAATGAMKQSIAAFKKLTPVKKGIRNLEEGIRLIDEGAQTGAIKSKFPSIKAASVKLDNIQGQLGLDVVGNTTFGALSESELLFAKDVALPMKLTGPELRKWLVAKRDAQRKLADYIEEAAIFLGTPGNTVADFLNQKKEQQRAQAVQGQPQVRPPQAPAGNRIGRFTVEVGP